MIVNPLSQTCRQQSSVKSTCKTRAVKEETIQRMCTVRFNMERLHLLYSLQCTEWQENVTFSFRSSTAKVAEKRGTSMKVKRQHSYAPNLVLLSLEQYIFVYAVREAGKDTQKN